jgi:mycothiol synthase
VHLADRLQLPAPYVARPYRGAVDHAAMTAVLAAYRAHLGDPERPSVEQFDLTYANLEDCDPELDIAVIERADGDVIGYGRTSMADLELTGRDCIVFAPVRPDHLRRPLFEAIVDAQEAHMRRWVAEVPSARFRAYAGHPGPDQPPQGEAAWLEERGYRATEWAASLVRPHLDEIPERHLPDGVELRPVSADQIRTIVAAHIEAFRGEWDFHEPTEADFVDVIDDPYRDESLWKVAWAGDEVVGQVKPFINPDENAERGYLRGYTEYISTHVDWRNRGIAGTLLAWSLQELKDRGMTEAALGVDTNNPGGAFQLYTSLGFELRSYEVVYTRDARQA